MTASTASPPAAQSPWPLEGNPGGHSTSLKPHRGGGTGPDLPGTSAVGGPQEWPHFPLLAPSTPGRAALMVPATSGQSSAQSSMATSSRAGGTSGCPTTGVRTGGLQSGGSCCPTLRFPVLAPIFSESLLYVDFSFHNSHYHIIHTLSITFKKTRSTLSMCPSKHNSGDHLGSFHPFFPPCTCLWNAILSRFWPAPWSIASAAWRPWRGGDAAFGLQGLGMARACVLRVCGARGWALRNFEEGVC